MKDGFLQFGGKGSGEVNAPAGIDDEKFMEMIDQLTFIDQQASSFGDGADGTGKVLLKLPRQ